MTQLWPAVLAMVAAASGLLDRAAVLIGERVAAQGSSIDPLVSLSQYGPLGLMVLGFITGWIVPGPVAKAQAAELARLRGLYEESIVPMTNTYATTMAEASKAMTASAEALSQATSALTAHRTREGG